MFSVTSIPKKKPIQRVAILNKKNLFKYPYDKWLLETNPEIEIFLFSQNDRNACRYISSKQHNYKYVALFNSWKKNRLQDVTISKIHKNFPFNKIIALSECDILRAGELRNLNKIDGMNFTAAQAFRNKLVMKKLAIEAGLAVPKFSSISSVSDIINFLKKNQYPIVIKPIDGAGSVGIHIIKNFNELKNWISLQNEIRDKPIHYIAEEYISAPMITVDGIMSSGKILVAMASSYRGTCFEVVKNQAPIALLQLDPKSTSARRAIAYASEIIASFPTTEDPTSFHLELFDTESGVLLCEIAARTGGGRINDLLINALGVNLEQWSCLGQAGFNPVLYKTVCNDEDNYFGFINLPKRGGLLISAPKECPFDGIIDYKLNYNFGEVIAPNKKVSDAVANVLFKASNTTDLHKLHNNIVNWYMKFFKWS